MRTSIKIHFLWNGHQTLPMLKAISGVITKWVVLKVSVVVSAHAVVLVPVQAEAIVLYLQVEAPAVLAARNASPTTTSSNNAAEQQVMLVLHDSICLFTVTHRDEHAQSLQATTQCRQEHPGRPMKITCFNRDMIKAYRGQWFLLLIFHTDREAAVGVASKLCRIKTWLILASRICVISEDLGKPLTLTTVIRRSHCNSPFSLYIYIHIILWFSRRKSNNSKKKVIRWIQKKNKKKTKKKWRKK
jgi:hypothetical protein